MFTTPTATEPSASGFTQVSRSPFLTGDALFAKGVLINCQDFPIHQDGFDGGSHAADIITGKQRRSC